MIDHVHNNYYQLPSIVFTMCAELAVVCATSIPREQYIFRNIYDFKLRQLTIQACNDVFF